MFLLNRTIGVCPQQNVLFSYLTVKEHLELFAALKGVPNLDIEQEVQEMLTRLGLSEKMNTPASCLSGGMKRKLQVCALESINFCQLSVGSDLK
jgi:ABC-type multidrug transport system ATPase subunit